MRIHRLRLQAFGPFPGTHDLDFDALGAAGLHLIHGATGSGKTSILDAICFAVFGQVPGSRRGLGGAANALADPRTVPEVDLDTTIAGRRLRFVRRPDHVRPKKRGDGVTTVRSSVELHEWVHDEWRPVSSRVQEVQHVVDTSLGLRLDQFTQVIMLPQGGFAEFLQAEPDARAGVLRRVFDIERFADIEQWFAEQRRVAADRLLVARAPLDRARTVVELALADLPDDPDESDAQETNPEIDDNLDTCPEQNLPDLVSRIAAQVATRATTAGARADAAEADARTAQADFLRAERTATLHAKGRAARAVLRELDAPETKAARLAAEAELATAERAARVGPMARRLRHLDHESQAAQQACVAAVPAAFRDQSRPRAGSDPAAHWAAMIERGSAPIRSADERAVELTTALRQAADSLDHDQQLQRAQHEHEQEGARLHDRREELAGLLEAARTAADELDSGEELLRLIDAATRRAERARDAADREHVHAEAVHETDESVSLATQHAEAQRRAHLEQLTGHLAAGLAPGRPCAVCGSTAHPAPAELPPGQVVTQDDVDAAEAAQQGTKEAFTAAMTDFTRAQATRLHAAAEAEIALASARTAATELFPGVDETPADLAAVDPWLGALRERADQHVQTARQARRRVQDLEARLEKNAAEMRAQAKGLDHVRLDQAAAQARAREAAAAVLTHAERCRTNLAAHDHDCPCATHGDASKQPEWPEGEVPDLLDRIMSGAAQDAAAQITEAVQRRHRAHRRLEAAVTAWHDAERQVTDLRRRRAEAAEAVAVLLDQEGFSNVDEVEEALRPAERRGALADSLERAARSRADARAVLADAEVVAATDAEPPDLAALSDTADSAQSRARASRDRATTLERVRGLLVGAARDLASAREALAPLRARHDALDGLAAVVNGERGAAGDRRMRLSAYVLAARLEEVVRLANERLATMTDRRFALEHDDGPGSRGTRGGLGLRVHDAWNGTSRPTRSLSGGETFLASLALALGLGDAIQQDSGGRQLETLFVDEGFGSLDEESLELVLEVLDELRSGGRSVGIVSHVAELRQRIPAQIEVRKAETGSSVRVHLPGGHTAA